MAGGSDDQDENRRVRIHLSGFPEDLFTFALLFPEGRLPNLHVTTQIVGTKDHTMDRVADATNTETVLQGPGCLPLADFPTVESARWTALEIMAPLQGFAALADANFTPLEPVSATIEGRGMQGFFDLRAPSNHQRLRLISADRLPIQRAAMPARVELMTSNPLAAYAGAVICGSPSWTEYYRVLEDIAGECDKTISRLHETGLISRDLQRAFTNAANNRIWGRHGGSGRTYEGDQRDLMNLLEAREVVRRVVTGWMDQVCGDYLPRDRVDGPALRFGLE